MRVELHPCYVLHGRHYRETSLILEVFSAEFGRLSLIAKGGRKQKNHKRALMQAGRPVNMAWTIRNEMGNEMGTLTAIEPAALPLSLGGRLLPAVFYINELLVKLLHRHEPHAELFSAYETALAALAKENMPKENAADQADGTETTLRLFEKRLLESLGYGLCLTTDQAGHAIEANAHYQYRLQTGPVRCAKASKASKRTACYSGQMLLSLASENLNDALCRRQAKRLMREVLAELLGDKKLISRQLYPAYSHEMN